MVTHKILIAFCLLIFLFSGVRAESQQDEQIVAATQSLAWLLGNWEGSGVQEGITYASEFRVEGALDGVVLIAKRSTTGGFKDEMLLGYGRGSNEYVATIFDNQKHIALYKCEISPNQIACSQITAPAGYQSRRIIRQVDPNNLSFIIEAGKAGEQLEKKVEINYRKQG